jgi:hypothetical protein
VAFHYIRQGYFGDKSYRLLSRDEGYFSGFLWQLPQLSAAGIGRISLPMLSAESHGKFTAEECQTLLASLQAKHRIIYDDEWLWVVNYFKYKPGASRWVMISARDALLECESKAIFDGWVKKYGPMERVKRIMGEGFTFRWPIQDPEEGVLPSLAGIEPEPTPMHLHRAEVDAVWLHYQRVMRKPDAMISPFCRQKILERLRENLIDDGVPRVVRVEDLMLAIDNVAKSAWHMGRDPKTGGHKYNALDVHILQSQDKFLYWLSFDGPGLDTPAKKREIVFSEEAPSPSAKWSGERTSPEEVKAIVKSTVKKLGGPTGGESTERVFRG